VRLSGIGEWHSELGQPTRLASVTRGLTSPAGDPRG